MRASCTDSLGGLLALTPMGTYLMHIDRRTTLLNRRLYTTIGYAWDGVGGGSTARGVERTAISSPYPHLLTNSKGGHE